MFAMTPRLVVIAASVFVALAIANSAAADVTNKVPVSPVCNTKKIAACQKACYRTYQEAQMSLPAYQQKAKRQYFQCVKGCKAEGCNATIAK